jgi:hypothetical protein
VVESKGANPQGTGTGRILTFHTGSISLIPGYEVKYFFIALSASHQCNLREPRVDPGHGHHISSRRWAGGAQRPVLRVIEPKKISAGSAAKTTSRTYKNRTHHHLHWRIGG